MQIIKHHSMKGCRERTYEILGNLYIDNITYSQLQRFIVSLRAKGVNQHNGEGLSQKSQKHYLTFISDVMTYAIRCGLIEDNPCRNVITVKTENSRRILKISADTVRLLQLYQFEEHEQMVNCGDQWQDTDRLFIKWNGEPMHPNTPYIWLERFCSARKLAFKGLHAFRHDSQCQSGGCCRRHLQRASRQKEGLRRRVHCSSSP